MHDSANPTRLTAHTAGKYFIYGNLAFPANPAGYRQVTLVRNGTLFIGENITFPSSNPNFSMNVQVSTHYELAAGDYVEIWVDHDVGTSMNVNAGAADSPEFGMVKVP